MMEILNSLADVTIVIWGLGFVIQKVVQKTSHKRRMRRIAKTLDKLEKTSDQPTPMLDPVRQVVIEHPAHTDQGEEARTFRSAYDWALMKGWQPVEASWIAQRTVDMVRNEGVSYGDACESAGKERIMLMEDLGRHDSTLLS